MQFKISCLLFITDNQGRLLMIKRNKAPNQGLWSPPYGKPQMDLVVSVECAKREAMEETGLKLADNDLYIWLCVRKRL